MHGAMENRSRVPNGRVSSPRFEIVSRTPCMRD